MKRKFCLIRHGESQSNAGEKTQHPQSINLTPKGRQEALDCAAAFPAAPDLIVTSSYVRTKQTAAPFFDRFGGVPTEEWNIHEFTFLSADKYKDTTNAERLPFLQAYWDRADPFYRDDASAESFADFAGRCRDAVERMKKAEGPLTIAFCHGYVMNGIRFCLAGGFDKMDEGTMRDFWAYHSANKIENCAVLEYEVAANDNLAPAARKAPAKPKKPQGPSILD